MSQDAHRRASRCRKSLAGLAGISVAIGTAVIRAAAPSLHQPSPPAPVLALAAPAAEFRLGLAAEYRLALPENAREVALALRRGGKSWQEFEAEFGLGQVHASPLLAGIQLAKYRLDELSFGADQFLRKLDSVLEFEFTGGGWHHVASRPVAGRAVRPVRGPFEDTKFKVDVAYREGGPYLGGRLILPLGR